MPNHDSECPSLLSDLTIQHSVQAEEIRLGGGAAAIERQHTKGRLTARERIEKLIDPNSSFFEIGLWAAFGMYEAFGGSPASGVVTGIGLVHGQRHMIVANDATVKAGAFSPQPRRKSCVLNESRLRIVFR